MTYTREDIIRIVQEEDVRFIRMQFVDIFGQLKNVAITAGQLEKALDNRVMIDGSSIEGFVRVHESDQYLRPDLSSFAIYPWRPSHGRVARLLCDVYNPDGTPFIGDPRLVLRKVIARARSQGFTLNVGPECEFFLFQTDGEGRPMVKTNDEAGYFDLGPLYHGESTRREVCLNLSLFKEDRNIFYDAGGKHGLSKEAYGFIAGIMEHIKAITAITNPLVNSYKRLVPGYEAPCYCAWSANNRSALIRIPLVRGRTTRVELRSPDPSCNPYLALAVCLVAVGAVAVATFTGSLPKLPIDSSSTASQTEPARTTPASTKDQPVDKPITNVPDTRPQSTVPTAPPTTQPTTPPMTPSRPATGMAPMARSTVSSRRKQSPSPP